ncbi:MAG: protein nirF, partial [Gammaproteobacteria bacterium]|nr:protein nirF [Gammaproteobacteria bacterium]
MSRVAICLLLLALTSSHANARGTGDLGLFIERASSSAQIIETSTNTSIGRVSELGDLSHASVVYSRDARFAYVFGRDGGLSKVDIL